MKANNYFNKTTKSIGITQPAKGSNGLPDKSLVVNDRKRLRPGHWLGLVLCFFQCSYAAGWVTERPSSLQKSIYPQRLSSGTSGRQKPNGIH